MRKTRLSRRLLLVAPVFETPVPNLSRLCHDCDLRFVDRSELLRNSCFAMLRFFFVRFDRHNFSSGPQHPQLGRTAAAWDNAWWLWLGTLRSIEIRRKVPESIRKRDLMWFDVICTFFSSKLFQFCTTPLIFRRDQARSGEESHARGNHRKPHQEPLQTPSARFAKCQHCGRLTESVKRWKTWNSNFKKHTGSFGSLVGKASSPLASAVGTALMSQNWFEKIRFNCIGKGQSMAHATTPCWIPKCTMQQERNGAFFFTGLSIGRMEPFGLQNSPWKSPSFALEDIDSCTLKYTDSIYFQMCKHRQKLKTHKGQFFHVFPTFRQVARASPPHRNPALCWTNMFSPGKPEFSGHFGKMP